MQDMKPSEYRQPTDKELQEIEEEYLKDYIMKMMNQRLYINCFSEPPQSGLYTLNYTSCQVPFFDLTFVVYNDINV